MCGSIASHAPRSTLITPAPGDGHRFQLMVTDLDNHDIAYLEALYRSRGRAERAICDAKDLGLANLPSASFAINQAWLAIVGMAQDLLAWARHLTLDGDLARAEPKRLRYSSCMPPPSSSPAAGAAHSASPRAGPGPPISSPPSTGSTPYRSEPEPRHPRPPAVAAQTTPANPRPARPPLDAARSPLAQTDRTAAGRPNPNRPSTGSIERSGLGGA